MSKLPQPVAFMDGEGALAITIDALARSEPYMREAWKKANPQALFTAEQITELMGFAVGEVSESRTHGMDTSDAHEFIEKFAAAYCKKADG